MKLWGLGLQVCAEVDKPKRERTLSVSASQAPTPHMFGHTLSQSPECKCETGSRSPSLACCWTMRVSCRTDGIHASGMFPAKID